MMTGRTVEWTNSGGTYLVISAISLSFSFSFCLRDEISTRLALTTSSLPLPVCTRSFSISALSSGHDKNTFLYSNKVPYFITNKFRLASTFRPPSGVFIGNCIFTARQMAWWADCPQCDNVALLNSGHSWCNPPIQMASLIQHMHTCLFLSLHHFQRLSCSYNNVGWHLSYSYWTMA